MKRITVLITILLAATQLTRATLITFESPTYTAGGDIVGVDGWFRYGGGAGGVVTPSGANTTVLEGAQSFELTVNNASLGRPWDTGTAVGDGSILSAHMQVANTTSLSGFYLLSDVGPGLSPAGVEVSGGEWKLYGSGGTGVTDVPVIAGDEYLVEMQLNFTSSNYVAYVTDLTSGGPRINLVTFNPIYYPSGVRQFQPPYANTAAFVAANGGMNIYQNGNATVFDDITLMVIPEPGVVSLLVLGGALFIWRKHRQA